MVLHSILFIRPLCGFYKFFVLVCICLFYGRSEFWILIYIRPFFGFSKFWILVSISPFYGFRKFFGGSFVTLVTWFDDFYLSQSSLEDLLDRSSPRSFFTL